MTFGVQVRRYIRKLCEELGGKFTPRSGMATCRVGDTVIHAEESWKEVEKGKKRFLFTIETKDVKLVQEILHPSGLRKTKSYIIEGDDTLQFVLRSDTTYYTPLLLKGKRTFLVQFGPPDYRTRVEIKLPEKKTITKKKEAEEEELLELPTEEETEEMFAELSKLLT